jgi:hypothetical protein
MDYFQVEKWWGLGPDCVKSSLIAQIKIKKLTQPALKKLVICGKIIV